MNNVKAGLLLIAVMSGMILAGSADAHGGRSRTHVGIWFGVPAPLFYPSYYYSPRYYYPYPPTVVVPAPAYPTTYIEQPQPAAAAPAPAQGSTAYWYFCRDTQTYYPYVQQCASPWQQVVPRALPPS